LYQYGSEEFFVPASVLKVATAAAAVDVLTADFHFKTKLGWRDAINKGQLNGDLYLQMSGDPTLKTQDLKNLVLRLKKAGIRSISGKIIVDTSHFRMVPYGPGWMWDELSYAYAAPLGSVVINKNKFAITVSAQPNSSRAIIQINAPSGVVHIINQVKVTEKYDKLCPLTVHSNETNTYRLGGCLVRNWGKQVRVLAIRDPWPYFKKELSDVFYKEGISVSQGIVSANYIPEVTWKIEHLSVALTELERLMLKKSDNLIADALFVELGRAKSQQGGNWQGGTLAVSHFLHQKVGIATRMSIDDGAGISRYNLIRPIELAELLHYIYNHKELYRVIYPALPISAKDGTLAWRTCKTAASGRVHAKTGTMTGVSALAGYIDRKDGHQLVFVMMMNGWVGKLSKWRAAENRLLTILAAGK
jgi:D-alanyl-D-alanine carboxypeptidase/D-alanyl-D-alanine-endopeptidase (penicillin-binding protein 4)